MTMKAISLWQPWASLWAAGIKIHETRSWPTAYRGWLAVHAAKHNRLSAHGALLYRELLMHHEYSQRISIDRGLPHEFRQLPFGAIVGLVYVVRCVPTHECVSVYPLEDLLGDWSMGRFAWQAGPETRLFNKPIPCKGRQGFFTVEIPDDLLPAPRSDPASG